MNKLSQQDQDYLCSAGFVAMGAAEVIFRRVYQELKAQLEEEALKRAEYKKIKKVSPAQAKMLLDEMAKNYFTPDQRRRYKDMMHHIELLMRDFEWVDSFALLEHLKTKLSPTEFVNVFDSLQTNSNELARLIFHWADWQDNHPDEKDDIMIESMIKNGCKTHRTGHLAELFKMQ